MVSLECLVGVLRVSGGCLGSVSMVSLGRLESNRRVFPHSAPSWILSKAEILASSSLQDGATKWYYFLQEPDPTTQSSFKTSILPSMIRNPCLCVWPLSNRLRGSLEEVWRVSGECLESVWKVSWRCMEVVWKMSRVWTNTFWTSNYYIFAILGSNLGFQLCLKSCRAPACKLGYEVALSLR